MTLEGLLDLIVDIEARYPVDRWQVGGIRMWPLIRNHLWWQIDESITAAEQPTEITGVAHRARASVRSHLSHTSRYVWANAADFRHTARMHKEAAAVCLAYSTSRVLLDGEWYERFYDPLDEALTALGLRSIHLELQHLYRVPRHAASRFVQLPLDLRYAARKRLFTRPPLLELPEYPSFLEHLGQLGIDRSDFRPERLAEWNMLLESASGYFEAALRRVGARLGFLEDFGLVPMAFILACHRCGIPSVELQHGVQGPLHFAYSRWTRVPPKGYELLPSVYWTWTGFEASTISEWTAGLEEWHRPVVGGNLLASLWEDGGPHSDFHGDAGATMPSGGGSDRLRVLVTLQKGIGPDRLSPLVEAIRAGKDAISWWVRMHPGMGPEEARTAAAMLDRGDGSVEVERASSLPLIALLGHADVHVTFHSSVVLEAEQFGVPSVAFSADAAALYPQQVASGWLVCVESPADLVGALRAQAARAGDLPRPQVDAPPAVDTIRGLLGPDPGEMR